MSSVSFADLGVGQALVSTLAKSDITAPTPVQQQAIPLLLQGRDLVACAPTGTGKTAAFLLPALQRIADGDGRIGRGPRILVLTPTRELAQQVAKASRDLSRALPRTSTVCVTGGESYLQQNRLLASPHEVLVATPGRLIDQLNNRRIDLSRVEVFVLDEADRMLDMGFSDDVFAIGDALPKEHQTVCFTATLSHAIRDLAGRLLNAPEWLQVERDRAEEAPIDQHVLYVDSFDHRHRLLEACLADEGLGQAIVFTSTKVHAEELAGQLEESGHAAVALHGDLNQRQRTRALNRLRRGDCKVLVATDVAARGIDVSTITHVINFQLPKFAEDYVHRIGRTGRAGASGQALSFVGREDVFALRKIEHFIGRKVQVSALEGLEASFRPFERRPNDGKGGEFRKPRFNAPRRGKPEWRDRQPGSSSEQDSRQGNPAWQDRSRGNGGWQDRPQRGGDWQDRGQSKGGWQNRGQGNGGWQDRGQGNGGWQDRGQGNGGWQDRGQNNGAQNRSQGGWKDRPQGGGNWQGRPNKGNGGWQDRGQGAGGWKDRGQGAGNWQDRSKGEGGAQDRSQGNGGWQNRQPGKFDSASRQPGKSGWQGERREGGAKPKRWREAA